MMEGETLGKIQELVSYWNDLAVFDVISVVFSLRLYLSYKYSLSLTDFLSIMFSNSFVRKCD